MFRYLKNAFHTGRYTLTDLVHNTLFGRPDVIIVGELHNRKSHSEDQVRMIARYKPEYVLPEVSNGYEELRNYLQRIESFEDFEHFVRKHTVMYPKSSLSDPKVMDTIRVYHAATQVGADIVGCDINRGDEESLVGLDALIRVNPHRERGMGEQISQYANKRKTDRPILAIIGGIHSRKRSEIYPVLDEAGVRYRIVKQRGIPSDNDIIKVENMLVSPA